MVCDEGIETLDRALRGEAFLVIDGGMGSQIQARGLKSSTNIPDMLCIEDPAAITAIHADYVHAGAQLITTNTFGANRLKLRDAATVANVVQAALDCAHEAHAPLIGLDLGPLGEFLEPLGELAFDEAVELFAEQVRAAMASPVKPDVIMIETMSDLGETRAAIRAAREYSELPVFATMTFDANGYTMMGVTPADAARELSAWGVSALGVNCSVGPDAFPTFIAQMRAETDLPIIAQPNAGLPEYVDGKTVYSLGPEGYIEAYAAILDAGATIVGSCCGTTPEYTAGIRMLVDSRD